VKAPEWIWSRPVLILVILATLACMAFLGSRLMGQDLQVWELDPEAPMRIREYWMQPDTMASRPMYKPGDLLEGWPEGYHPP
jgi:hypothetical protein